MPVLGIVENMGLHICPECGHESHIFGAGGGERIAHDYDTVLLATLPLAIEIREQADSGRPTVAADPEGAARSGVPRRRAAPRRAVMADLARRRGGTAHLDDRRLSRNDEQPEAR